MKKLSKWLRGRGSGLSPDEMLRVWKGLHYCFWMSDKMLVQEDLAERISAMVHVFEGDNEAAVNFIRCGLATLGREWFGLDRWRMDKFMMFARRLIRQVFVFCRDNQWSNAKEIAEVGWITRFIQFVITIQMTTPCFRCLSRL